MNRNQFWILIGGSSLVVLLLILQITFTRQYQYSQARVLAAQQVINQGNECQVRLRQLASRIYQVSAQTQDQGLKDLLARQQIIVNPPASAPAEAGAASAPPTR